MHDMDASHPDTLCGSVADPIRPVSAVPGAQRGPKGAPKIRIRPLGLRTPLLKVLHKQVVTQNLTEVKAHLEPVQLGMSRAGAQKLVFSIRGLLNAKPDFVCVKIDCRKPKSKMGLL